ncbi:hypothetical protein NSQ59_25025 [Margalitia sp. FSL K6-0131]|uniref:hypothetical protein n=1 Tax=Margalitia sp. FSL K6-0131 TaxID=2954604 RepID=UPI0030F776B6
MLTYDHYLKMNDSLTFQEAIDIHSKILQTANTKDEDFQELLEDVIKAANNYANIRANWSIQTTDERKNIDEARTIQHNDFMATLKILARYMKNQGWDSEWMDKLGTIENDRKRFGDFACYMVCVNSLNAR